MPSVNDDLPGRLVDEAARILAESGPAALSVRKIATAAGTSTMAVYTHFGGKDTLLSALYREGFRRLGARLGAVGPGEPMEALLTTGRAYRDAALASPHLYALMFGPPPAGLVLTDDDRAAADTTFRPLVDRVADAVDAGLLTGDVDRIASHLWVVAHGMVGLELSGRAFHDDGPADARYDEALTLAAAPFLTTR
ncbi:TetR/AcrR family transcriptional regulator [Williamsia serinedens]|uniref:Transcriptional regulator, TetR family n=1 Tax=Williamsia serinedens TaxID=391736 RepID=A0ABT1H4T3_9NOCA|nr:TetR/AcrR family transcriptional regulator [Williamsia serinedens]MCP2161583.1 transcriptional regulator, TetR family [Williamsia serinedens]